MEKDKTDFKFIELLSKFGAFDSKKNENNLSDIEENEIFEKYYKISKKMISNRRYRIFGLKDMHFLILCLTFFTLFIFTNFYSIVILLILFLFLKQKLSIDISFFNNTVINWKSYMLFVLKKNDFLESEINELEDIINFEKDKSDYIKVTDLLTNKYLDKQQRILSFLRIKQKANKEV